MYLHMLSRQMRARRQRHKPLRRIGIRSPVSHDQQSRPVYLSSFALEPFVRKGPAIDTLSARPILLCEVSTLDHELINDSVDGR